MAIVPQISSVQPNTEVLSTSPSISGNLSTNSSLSDIQTFIDETSAGSNTQITFQQGNYTASGDIEIPANTYVVIMNGAFLPNINFVDSSDDPSTNVIDLNVLATNNTGAGVVFNIETDETLSVGTTFGGLIDGGVTSGASKIGVALDQNPNEILLNSKVNEGTDTGDFDTVSLPQQSIVVRQNNTSVESLQFGAHEILYSDGGSVLKNTSIGSNTVLTRTGGSDLEGLSVAENEMIVRFFGEDIQTIALNDDSLHDAFDLQAQDISNGTFKSTTGTYEFDTNVKVDGFFRSTANAEFIGDVNITSDLSVANEIEVPRIFLPATAAEFETTNRLDMTIAGNLNIGVQDETNINVQNDMNLDSSGGSINLSVDLGDSVVLSNGTTSELSVNSFNIQIDTNASRFNIADTFLSGGGSEKFRNASYLQITNEGYIDIPVHTTDDVPGPPIPEGYIRIWARVDDPNSPFTGPGSSGSDGDGRVIFRTHEGTQASVDPS